jgi:hypothetical protein
MAYNDVGGRTQNRAMLDAPITAVKGGPRGDAKHRAH